MKTIWHMSLKATDGNDAWSEFHLKLVLPWGEVSELFALFFNFSFLVLPVCLAFYQQKVELFLACCFVTKKLDLFGRFPL